MSKQNTIDWGGLTLLVDKIEMSDGPGEEVSDGGVGYSTGDGGTVTQATSKSTGVTLNTLSGQITMNNASLAADAEVTFTVTNDKVTASDVVIVNHQSVGNENYIPFVSRVSAGAFNITVSNAGGTAGEAIVLNFVVIKGATA